MIYRNTQSAAKKFFAHTSLFILGFSMSAFTVLVLVKALTAVFDASIIDQFKSIYYLTNYSDTTVSLINGIFGAVVTLCLCAVTVGLFFSMFSASKDNMSGVVKGIRLIKYSVIVGLIISVITAVCSVASVSVINHYALKAAAFQQTVSNNSGKLFILAMSFGAVSVILEIAVIRLMIAMESYFKGTSISRGGTGLAGFISGVGAVAAASGAVSLLYDVVTANYKAENFSPASLVSDILNILISISLIIFFISLMMSVYDYSNMFVDDEYFYYDSDDFLWDDDEKFEIKVFPKDEDHRYDRYSEPKKLMPPVDMLHTEYPDNTKQYSTVSESV